MLRRQQRGVAVITALLIVALAATISAGIATDLQLEVRRTANLVNTDQALFYILPAEKLAMNVLLEDAKNNKIDHYGESWALSIPPIPVEGGQITGQITDLQACFNLNTISISLPAAGGAGGPGGATGTGTAGTVPAGSVGGTPPVASTKTALDRLKRLLQLPAIGIGVEATDALVDWIDADANTTVPNGAEDGYYLNLDIPYRTANQALKSVSTLRLVRGFEDANELASLMPFVCAIDTATPINVNTAPAEVLLSLDNNITVSEVDEIIRTRELTPFNSISEMTKIGNLSTKITNSIGLSVDTSYFLLTTRLEIGNARRTIYSVINRTSSDDASIIARMQNTL